MILMNIKKPVMIHKSLVLFILISPMLLNTVKIIEQIFKQNEFKYFFKSICEVMNEKKMIFIIDSLA